MCVFAHTINISNDQTVILDIIGRRKKKKKKRKKKKRKKKERKKEEEAVAAAEEEVQVLTTLEYPARPIRLP